MVKLFADAFYGNDKLAFATTNSAETPLTVTTLHPCCLNQEFDVVLAIVLFTTDEQDSPSEAVWVHPTHAFIAQGSVLFLVVPTREARFRQRCLFRLRTCSERFCCSVQTKSATHLFCLFGRNVQCSFLRPREARFCTRLQGGGDAMPSSAKRRRGAALVLNEI